MKTAFTLLLLAITTTLAAQQTYRLDEIRFEGSRIPEHIVRSELMIETGRAWTQDEIRYGVYRLRRLPFIFSANWRLAPSPVDGLYTLIVSITDDSSFFYGVDIQGVGFEEDDGAFGTAEVGGRLFTRKGVGELTIGNSDSSSGGSFQTVSLSYRGFGLFGSAASASFALQKEFADDSFDPSPAITLDLPLTLRQGLRARASYLHRESERELFEVTISDETEVRNAELKWVFDSTDDPILARRGLRVAAGPEWLRTDTSGASFIGVPPTPAPRTREREEYRIVTEGSLYRPLGEKDAIFSRFLASASRTDQFANGVDLPSNDSTAGALSLGLARNLGRNVDSLTDWRGRLESSLTYHSSHSEAPFSTSSFDSINATAAWVHRHRLGNVRLALTYVWD